MSTEKNIKSPDLLWQYFDEYHKELKTSPFKQKDWVGKDAIPVDRERERPITLVGFSNYLADKGITSNVDDYFKNKDGMYDDFIDVCRRIKNVRAQDHEEGAMISKYHHGVTARLNGWAEVVENKNTNVKILSFDPLSNATTNNSTKEDSGTKETD